MGGIRRQVYPGCNAGKTIMFGASGFGPFAA
jgi:hypothetical protein